MKFITLFILTLFFIPIQAQEYNVKDYFTAFFDVIQYSDQDVVIKSYDADIHRSVLIKDFENAVSEKITIGEFFDYEELILILSKKISDDEYLFVSLGTKSNYHYLVFSQYKNGIETIISENSLFSKGFRIGRKKQKQKNGFLYSSIQIRDSSRRLTDFLWVKLSAQNELSYNTMNNPQLNKDDYPGEIDIEFLNDTTFLLRAVFTMSLMDLDFNELIKTTTIYDNQLLQYGKLHGSNPNNFYLSSLSIGISAREQQNIREYKIESDSFILIDELYLPNPQNKTLVNIIELDGRNDTLVTTSYDQGDLFDFNDPKSFYVSKTVGTNLLWSKTFGGNYNFNIFFVKMIQDKIYLGGNIYNYFRNEKFRPFYLVLDCDGNEITSSIDLTATEINIHPNPAADHIILNSDYKKKVDFILYNSLGQKVFSKETTMNQTRVDLPNGIPKGNYFYQILGGGEGVLNSGKLILE